MNDDGDRLERAWQYVAPSCQTPPVVAVILGSGLGQLADQIDQATAIPFAEIPGFAASTAGGHRGTLILGTLEGRPIVAMAGRLHRYEGHSPERVTFPVRLMRRLGAETLIASNAAGGVNPKLCVGDIVVIRDHIDWMRGAMHSPVIEATEHVRREGNVYDAEWAQVALLASMRHDFVAYEGCYLATLGPNYETRAEYRMMRRMGVDVVGMSTVPEVLAARHFGMRVLALSMVSNVARPDHRVVANHEEVLAAGRSAAVKMETIVRDVVRRHP